jgi:penicillin-binding protein 1A
MKEAVKDRPVRTFQAPEGVVFARIDRQTGLLAGPGTKQAIIEAFKPGTVPRAMVKQVQPGTNTTDFLKQDVGY